MKPLSTLIEELQRIDPNVSGNVRAFEAVLADIVALRTADAIPPLLDLLDDRATFDEVMFSVVHGVEAFDDPRYIGHVLRKSKGLCDRSPRWASILFMRILNSEPSRLELVSQLGGASSDVKCAIKGLMEKISAHNVQFLTKTSAVIDAAS